MSDEEIIEQCKARIDAMHVLLASGWEPKRIALALGMAKSWAVAERWMQYGKPER
jgi:hypothetical protein